MAIIYNKKFKHYLKQIKTVLFFCTVLVFLYSLFHSTGAPLAIELQITSTLAIFLLLLFSLRIVFKSQMIKSEILRILIYYIAGGILLTIVSTEIMNIFRNWHYYPHLLPKTLERYGHPSKIEYIFHDLGKVIPYGIRRPLEILAISSILGALMLLSSVFIELTWRNPNNRHFPQSFTLNIIYSILLFTIINLSAYLLTIDFLNPLQTILFLTTNLICTGILSYLLFIFIKAKLMQFLTYFILALLFSFISAYLCHSLIEEPFEGFGVLALCSQSWLLPLVWYMIFKTLQNKETNHD